MNRTMKTLCYSDFAFVLEAVTKSKKGPATVMYKTINKTRLDKMKLFVEDSNQNPVDFNNDYLTFTFQIIKFFAI